MGKFSLSAVKVKYTVHRNLCVYGKPLVSIYGGQISLNTVNKHIDLKVYHVQEIVSSRILRLQRVESSRQPVEFFGNKVSLTAVLGMVSF